MVDDYQALLQRARKQLPEDVGTGERFQLPDVEIMQEGKTTIVRNYDDLLDTINRASDHMTPILLRELGTAGSYEGGRLVLQGRPSERMIVERVKKYVETYVTCGECGRPDTHLQREDRTLLLKCDACGAHRPVRGGGKKKQEQGPRDAVEEGGVYTVKIEDVGKRGDGVARLDKFTIFVDGAKTGQILKVRVNKVTGTLAFAEIAPEQ